MGLALLYGDFNADGLDQLHGLPAIGLLVVTFTALILVAADEVRKKRVRGQLKQREIPSEPPIGGGPVGTGFSRLAETPTAIIPD